VDENLVESGQLAEPPVERDRPTSVELSRKIAVQRVFQGGALVSAGAVLSGATMSFLGIDSFSLSMVGMGLLGFGLVQLGRAAKHLKKYGSRASLIGFVTATGLGLSLVSLAVSQSIGDPTSPVWAWAVRAGIWAYYGFGTVMLLLVLRALILWAVDPSGLFREEIADAG